ncbi:MAG: fumarylacetoacetate hydrolase family protein [Candidatus Latescibacteria bacterium]|nr:fumarylacetoacetate hydrolase family protein [Candidatus Latescibacterota bacterium]
MRIYSLSENDNDFLGIEEDNKFIDLTRAIALYEASQSNYTEEPVDTIEQLIFNEIFITGYLGNILEFISKHSLSEDLAISDDYSVNPPLYPGKIIALGNNYRKHIEEMNQKLPEKPVLFGKWPSTVIGHGDAIVKPSWIGSMSYEAELAFIIGKPAKNVSASEAMNYIAGYTCLNDITARDIQRHDLPAGLPWMPSKNFDTFTPMGPCVLLAEMVKDPVEIDVKSTVNGELRQNGNTRDFIFDIPTVLEYISKIMTLEPGDVVTTGTPEGVGAIEPGDVVEITCGGIGTLSNHVTAD